jgi:hypothetical protein
MIKLVAAGFVSALSFVLWGASPVLADRTPPYSGAPTLKLASQVGPSRGGASGLPRGYLPLHAREYALAKAAANAKAGVGNGRPKPRPGGGGGPTIFNPPNVAPSFDGTYESGVTPPDTTGAVGPDRYIETVNTKYAIYSRSGSPIGGGSLSALTGISGGLFGYSLSDPQMMWDAATRRVY